MLPRYLAPLDTSIADLIEPTPGFRFYGTNDTFALSESRDDGFTCIDAISSLRTETRIRIVGCAAVIEVALTNTGEKPSDPTSVLEPLSLILNHPSEQCRHIFANGGTTESFYPPTAYRTQEWTQSTHGLVIGSHIEGRSSNQYLSFLITCRDTAPDSPGFFVGMEWSGAWEIRFERIDNNRSALTAAVRVNNLQLDPGETLDLPPVHLGFFEGGPESGTNALRRYLYEYVCPHYQGKPTLPRVSYDHWFGIDNALTETEMRRQAGRAAELGVEVFVVDASWFPGDFPWGVGNWDLVDEKKFPNGLEPLADYVRSLGMDFGLWFEVERGCHETSIVKQHPDWYVAIDDWSGTRNLHLDFSKPEVQDGIIDLVGGWIERLDIRWSRWDYNTDPRPYWDKVDPTHKIQFAYMKGLYRVLDTLMAKYPNWMVEQCSSGGRRIDIGTIRRAHTFWFSDQSENPYLCRYMQARANRFLPGHLCNSSVAVGRGRGDEGFNDAAILSRMLGKLAFDGDVASWSPEFTRRAAKWAAAFKQFRHLMVQDFYQLLPLPSTAEDPDAVQFAAHDGSESVVLLFNGLCAGRRTVTLDLKGMTKGKHYAVERIGPVGEGRPEETDSATLSAELDSHEAALWHIRRVS